MCNNEEVRNLGQKTEVQKGHLEMEQKDSRGLLWGPPQILHHQYGIQNTYLLCLFLAHSQPSVAPCVCPLPQLTLTFGFFSSKFTS